MQLTKQEDFEHMCIMMSSVLFYLLCCVVLCCFRHSPRMAAVEWFIFMDDVSQKAGAISPLAHTYQMETNLYIYSLLPCWMCHCLCATVFVSVCPPQDNYVQPHALSSFLYARGLSTIHLSYRHGMEGMLLQNSSDVINPGASAGAHEVQTRHAESFVGCGIKVSK